MKANYSNNLYKQYEQLLLKFEKQETLLKDTNNLVNILNKTIETLNGTIEKLKEVINEKDNEILGLKSKNDRDSSNSNRPS